MLRSRLRGITGYYGDTLVLRYYGGITVTLYSIPNLMTCSEGSIATSPPSPSTRKKSPPRVALPEGVKF